jgi:transposase
VSRPRRPELGSHHRLAGLPTAARDLPRPSPAAGRRLAEQVIATFPSSCPIPEVARLGRTLRAWRPQILAYFTTTGVSNGGTGAVNLIIEKTRRLAHDFRNFHNYRLRILLAANGTRPYRRTPIAHA